MLSACAIPTPERLFRPWQQDTQVPIEGQLSDYIELPAVDSYEQLEHDMAFDDIQEQFLSDIRQLQSLARHYVNEQYDDTIDAFHDKLETPPVYLQESLLPLYRETRFHIHQLINQLKNQLDATAEEQNYIASVLHNCLEGIDLCPAGVHSRFANSYADIQAPEVGLDGMLFKVRKNLFHEFIGAFIFQCQRDGWMNSIESMEVHWFNALHNLYCDVLALEPIIDPSAPGNIPGSLLKRFLASVPLAVSPCTIIRTLSTVWSDQLSTVLHKQGITAWETDVITAGQITAERTQALDDGLFKPVNHLLQATPGQALDLWRVIEESGDDSYRLNRFREKMLFWLSDYFCPSSGQIFAVIPNGGGSRRSSYVGSINDIFFWVFDHDHRLHIGHPCTLQTDNHTTLTLAHLVAFDFSTWPQQVCYALLTQAMAQTESAEDIAAFFMNRTISEQLDKTPQPVLQALSQQLREKLLCGPDCFMSRLSDAIIYQMGRMETGRLLQHQTLRWLLDTPLLKPTLSFLLRMASVDLAPITHFLTSWQIVDLSAEDLRALLTAGDCRRLFHQAMALDQAQILSNLLLTGHCDHIAIALMDGPRSVNLLRLFASHGNLSGLIYLLTLSGSGFGRRANFNWSPLNSAAEFGHTDCLATLLAIEGANVNYRVAKGWTPLLEAARHGHCECIKLLLAAKDIRVNAFNDDRWTALICAARHGHTQCVEALLSDDRTLTHYKTEDGETALTFAADFGHTGCVKALLKAPNTLVNLPNSSGSTPLLCAAKSGHTECLKVLLTVTGIDVNSANNEGCTPLHAAVQSGEAACIEALLAIDGIKLNERDCNGSTPLLCAAQLGHTECLKWLLTATGIDVNSTNNMGYTPLHAAAQHNAAPCVEALVAIDGIKLNERTRDDWTPTDLAAIYGRVECLKVLLATGRILVNQKNAKSVVPLHAAAFTGHTECVDALLGVAGIDINLTDKLGWTSLHGAAEEGQAGCVEALLNAQHIKVNKKNNKGSTALHSAARYGHADCVELLIRAEATKVNRRSLRYQKTPLMLAIKHGNVACARLLIGHERTNINKLSLSFNTALTLARARGLTEIVDLLEADPRLCRSVDRVLRFLKRH